jgi:hypothetical protein
MNKTLSTSMLAAVGAAILSTACTSGIASPAAGGQPADAVVSAARELDPSNATTTTEQSDHDRVTYFESVFDQLRQVPALAPLFSQYGIPDPTQYGDDDHQVTGLVTLLRQVRITIQGGSVTLVNRQTGAVIYTAPLSNISGGVFYPENMPGGATAPATCTAFTYSAWGTCTNGLQTRTVLTSSPAGCTGGTPVLSQACTSTPAICTAFTYSAWGTCTNGLQTRTVLTSSPAGCTGGTPVLSQACTSTPATCTAFTYSAWGTCTNNLQTRTVLTSSPAGCTGGTPVLSQACTSVPPACTYTYGTWGACQPNGTQTRTLTSSSPAGCTGTPVLSQTCTYTAPTCTSFTYSAWGACQPNGTQTRTVASSSPTGCTGGTPVLSQACTYAAPNPVTFQNVVSSCTGCHGLTSNTTVFRSGGYTVTGRSAAQWLTTVNNMVNLGASLAPGTTAQNYADYLANSP